MRRTYRSMWFRSTVRPRRDSILALLWRAFTGMLR
jgi:hypothetical protein